jgi:hypothetical protein
MKDGSLRFSVSKDLKHCLLDCRVVCQNVDVIFPIAKDSEVDTPPVQFGKCSLQFRLLLRDCSHDPNSTNDFRRTALFELLLNAPKEKRRVVSVSRAGAVRISFSSRPSFIVSFRAAAAKNPGFFARDSR